MVDRSGGHHDGTTRVPDSPAIAPARAAIHVVSKGSCRLALGVSMTVGAGCRCSPAGRSGCWRNHLSPALSTLDRSSDSSCRTSPTMMREGRIRSLLDHAPQLDLAGALGVGLPALHGDDVGQGHLQLEDFLRGHDRSRGGTAAARQLSSVVLPGAVARLRSVSAPMPSARGGLSGLTLRLERSKTGSRRDVLEKPMGTVVVIAVFVALLLLVSWRVLRRRPPGDPLADRRGHRSLYPGPVVQQRRPPTR